MKCETLLTIVNAIICTVIFLRVFYFKRDGRQHCKKGGWLAFLILAYSSSVPIRAYLILIITLISTTSLPIS
ncbi:phage holin family protein [Proteus mirabilis]